MSSLAPWMKPQYFDSDGVPLSGGKLYSYKAGTTTPLTTYTDASGLTPNTNPIILDASGYASVWLGSDVYKFVLKDSNDVQLWSVDNVNFTSSVVDATTGTSHAVTDGQAAADLTGETVDSATYIAAKYEFDIIRGTTVFASGVLYLQFLNSAWRIKLGSYSGDVHGVTWSLSGTTIAQLRAALDSGAGDGTIYLSRRLIAA